MLNRRKIPKVLSATFYRLSVAAAVAIAVVFQGSGPMASEGEAPVAALRGSGGPSTMDVPLSTWIGPGDAIRVKAYPDTASFIAGVYTVYDSGFVMLPVLGRVQVTNMSIAGLNVQLTEAYAKYTAYPNVQIEPMIHLLLFGGFLRPGVYLVNPLSTFSNALSVAGGTIRDDGLRLLRWERDGKVLKSDLTVAVEGAMSLWALGFTSGDQICVTLRTRRDILPIVSFVTSTVVTSGTLLVTLLVLLK